MFQRWPRFLLFLAFILAILSAVACRQKPANAAPAVPEVGVITVQPEQVVLTTELPGRTSAYLVAEIRPQVNGLIKSRHFQEGAMVKAGELLYQIDPAPYEAAYSQAKATLATAQADLATAQANLPAVRARAERYSGLVGIHAVGEQDRDDATAALRQAETTVDARKAAVEASRAALESSRINLSYTPIKSPITGRIGKSNITVGALATAYQANALAVVQQLNPIYVDVVQSNADLLRLRASLEAGRMTRDGAVQKKVKLLLEDGTVYPLAGTLQFRDVTVDPTTGSVTLRILFSNPKEVLLPGVYVKAVVEEGVREKAILVPQEGVTRDPKGTPIAWVVDKDNKVERRILEVERTVGNRWLVTSGLAAGDRLIVEGTGKVRAGVPVRPVPATAKPAAPEGKPAASLQAEGKENHV
jgi:membrane fusion protein (multidrug efflux system)